MPSTSGYGANAFLDGFMRSYDFLDSLQDRKQVRAQREKDSAWQDEARNRQRQDWQYQDDTRETPEQVQERRGLTLDNLRTQNESGKFGLESARSNQAYTEATRATPEEVQQQRGLALESARLGNASRRQSIAISGAEEKRRSETYSDKRAADAAMASLDFLNSDFAKQFDDPAVRESALKFDDLINNGKQDGNIDPNALYSYGNRLFSRELQQGVGDKLQDGSAIKSKRIVAARRNGDNFVLELAVTAQRPDGSTYEYNAPVTKNRTSDDTDEVLMIPVGKIRDRVRGASYLARAIDQSGGREAAIQELRRHVRELGQDPSTFGTQKGTGAQQQYLKFVADNVFGGDISKAYASLRGGNVRQIAASIAKSMYDKQDMMPHAKRKSMDQLYSDALQMVQAAGADQSNPAAVTDFGDPSGGAAAPADSGDEDYSALWGAN